MLWWQARACMFLAGLWFGRAVELERARVERKRQIRDLERAYSAPSVSAEDGAAS